MKELISRLTQNAGLNEEQALKAIETIKDFAKEKFPVFAGAIDRLFEKYGPREEEDFVD